MQSITDSPDKNNNRHDKFKLKPCPSCHKKPSMFQGKIGLTNCNGWSVMCVNNQCSKQPSTGNCDQDQKAADQWNTGMVSDSLFLVDGK